MNTDVMPNRPASTATTSSSATFDPAKLPDDATLLKQMIAELLMALKRDRRELAEVRERLHALLERGQRSGLIDPNQPLLFPELAQAEPAEPAPPPVEQEPSRRKSRPHGRRRPARQLRRERRRYE